MATAEDDLLICKTCGNQFDVPVTQPLSACKICDDPRQYVPPTGQAWTSLGELKATHHHNKFIQDDVEKNIWSIVTEPKVAIGQRACLLETQSGNVLWDCISFIDEETTNFIKSKGGLKAIVISHPHYYSTHQTWTKIFNCPVYIAAEDSVWRCRQDSDPPNVKLIQPPQQTIVPGVEAIVLGGHFPGSLVLLWDKKLFIADTIMTAPSALYFIDRPKGTTSYNFMWSYPNMIPLSPHAMLQMWQRLKPFDFESTFGAFTHQNVRDNDVKRRVLESMRIQAEGEGYGDHAIFQETV